MSLIELLITAISLAMDAFAVAICKGVAMRSFSPKKGATVALYFGGFQALMPFLGYLLASTFADKIKTFDHWIAFVLLALIGANMIKESFEKEDCPTCDSLSLRPMLPMAIATSIDAMAVGVAIAMLDEKMSILFSCSIIGIITFLIAFVGVKIGTVFGMKFKQTAEICGGAVLILLGTKILLEHLGVLSF